MNTVLKIVGVILLAFIALLILGWVIRIVSFVFSLALGIVFLLAMVWLIKTLFKISTGEVLPAGKSSYVVQDYTRNAVAMFDKEPSASELLKAQVSLSSLDSQFELDNNTEVLPLSQAGNGESVRIKVKSGVHKGREGWVASAFVREQKLLEQ